MADRSSNVYNARHAIAQSGKLIANRSDEAAVAMATIAQANATLALVEQQRIANLIALAALGVTTGEAGILETEAAYALVGPPDPQDLAARPTINPDIADALGIKLGVG